MRAQAPVCHWPWKLHLSASSMYLWSDKTVRGCGSGCATTQIRVYTNIMVCANDKTVCNIGALQNVLHKKRIGYLLSFSGLGGAQLISVLFWREFFIRGEEEKREKGWKGREAISKGL